MAFIKTSTETLSFAEYADITNADKRVFDDNNEIDVQDDIENELIKSTTIIVNRLSGILGITVDSFKIEGRLQDFTDLCVYHCLAKRILPGVANFGDDDVSQRNKMAYYATEYEVLFKELVESGDWYDTDADGTVEDSESVATVIDKRRVR